jgi:hypothetical protein
LGATLAAHLDKPRVYIGCMKSGEVFSEPWGSYVIWNAMHFMKNTYFGSHPGVCELWQES